MSALKNLSLDLIQQAKTAMDTLAKSWPSAGYQNLEVGGRVGQAALTIDSLDEVIRSITIEDKDFLLIKDIPTQAVRGSVHHYRIKIGLGDHDLAGFENFMPAEVSSQYMMVSEVLKVYGTAKTIGHMTEMINDLNGYAIDVEEENERDAALLMSQQMERDFYHGGDYFMDSSGAIDPMVAASVNSRLRSIRGIQANVREGNASARGIPQDWEATQASRGVVFDQRGAAIGRESLDTYVTAVRDNGNRVAEGHTTSSALQAFRATFFPVERGDINTPFAIRGAAVTNDEHGGLPIDTCAGTITLIANRFKYLRDFPNATSATSSGPLPSTPAHSTAMGGAAVGSGFVAGNVFRYRVQAININGRSLASTATSITVGAGQDNFPIDVTITNSAEVEYYAVFRTPVETSGLAGTEMFIGNIMKSNGGSTIFRDAGRLLPGLCSMLLVPKDKNRAKMLTIGSNSMMNKLELGRNGLALQTLFVSYFACMVQAPRSFSVIDNVFQKRRGVDQ